MADSVSNFTMGEHTFSVPMTLFALNRRRLAERVRRARPARHGVILLAGGKAVNHDSADTEYLFRQESYFNWAFGVQAPDYMGAIEVSTGRSILFMPRLPPDYSIWMGKLETPEEAKKRFEVDEVYYTDEVAEKLNCLEHKPILTLKGLNTDSGLTTGEATFEGIEEFDVNNEILHPLISECRVIKTPLELQVLRYVADVSSRAHCQVMRTIRPGMYEYQGEATFLEYCYSVGGCRQVSYTCICGSGPHGAILHYGHAGAPNDRRVHDGDMLLFDMGAGYFGFASDITCSFPANGKFTEDQKIVYNAVLRARDAVLAQLKPGVSWVEMHKLANCEMLTELRDKGILKGEIEDMMKNHLGAIFQPHGLGHLLGCDVHDVGGYLPGNPPRPSEPGVSKLRTARVLEAGMVLTVEPGCYFIESLLKKAMEEPLLKRHLVVEAIDRLRHFGGVRIEDDVVITEDGVENLTKVPRTVEEIELMMSMDADVKSWSKNIKCPDLL